MSVLPDDLREAFTKLVITVDFIRRDLDETRQRLRSEFVSISAHTQLVADVAALRAHVDKTRDEIERDYVTKQEHAPLRLLVYGAVAIILSTVFGALILLVVKKGGAP